MANSEYSVDGQSMGIAMARPSYSPRRCWRHWIRQLAEETSPTKLPGSRTVVKPARQYSVWVDIAVFRLRG
ncbi:hypothetical protein N7510_011242 [Penicillium lagena]|uniref:uncharacterized protein n=1 Tax=Penicillium lagena TaxID=94218 RepID=UPI002541A122|nr:uncharacterized protein N7510_011242 [Penicillium lagena]KAJ5601708.1 hypothetical protein N7510_011242 [Penicillium lagena]